MTEPRDGYEQFVALFTRHEPDLRGFVRQLMPTWDDTQEVMQQVAIVLWRRFADFEAGTDFRRWACVVARFEVLQYRRKMARDRLVFSDALLELMADEGIEELDRRTRETAALRGCLEKLAPGPRELVTQAYGPGASTKEIAQKMGKSPAALYMKLNRIRSDLHDCIRRHLEHA